ncbi:hypothetical protein B1207_00935 [Legionella quinlivanii]|uniref:Hemerythrin-like domain-containing protein n=1 Tax=Legionella quinlivanii TaxID=45073 RepID=A0A364LN67_9GAMM|nr:hypothetical protein [Legionella quinlivanii]RAP38485.1 hypothetical protein B1207_00935 [Legionella quinlivanii]
MSTLIIKRESHLFACHKFLEERGAKLLIMLAKVDFRDTQEVKIIYQQLENYVSTLVNHARWEEEFIFNKFFRQNEVALLLANHTDLESFGMQIVRDIKELLNLPSPERMHKGKQVYLDFRRFYASNLIHFYEEETSFLSLLQERASDDEIRAIDKPIYQDMGSNDILEMLEQLLPPINISEKEAILNDIKRFNNANFVFALPEIKKILSPEEVTEIL